jgi:drug/metabolite transporter (DMT)-like permease
MTINAFKVHDTTTAPAASFHVEGSVPELNRIPASAAVQITGIVAGLAAASIAALYTVYALLAWPVLGRPPTTMEIAGLFTVMCGLLAVVSARASTSASR